MEQSIQIKAIDLDGNQLGTFTISIDYKGFVSDGVSDEIDNLILNNVPIVEIFDNKTPIQYYKDDNFNANLLLLEDYEYAIDFESSSDLNLDVFYSFKNRKNSPLKLFKKTNAGFLKFGSYVGKTFIDIYSSSKLLFKYPIEVRSRKLDYGRDYATMIGDLSRFSSGLIYELDSPVYQSLEVGDTSKTPYEDFMLLEYLFEDENLPSTVEYLSRNLYTSLEETREEVPSSLASNVDPSGLIEVYSNSDNLERLNDFDEDSVWSRTKGYVPIKINETKYVDHIDTPENRFYKNFLYFIDDLIDDLIKRIDEGYCLDKLHEYKHTLSYYLSSRYFLDISPMDHPPLNSQVLQKKEGYRDILEYYLLFEFGFKLNWNEVVEDFRGYEKKVYRLYEYWCYFELLDIIGELTDTEIAFDDLFDENDFNISLKEGLIKSFDLILDLICSDSSYSNDESDIKIDLMYNKTFTRASEFDSYSVDLRPDYTLSIHINDKNYLVHFDAKYKLNIEDESYKNQDIVKMHSYKDAIRDTIAAYVLYPGSKRDIFYEKKGYLESVGAFPLSPGEDRENKKELLEYIKKIIFDLIKT